MVSQSYTTSSELYNSGTLTRFGSGKLGGPISQFLDTAGTGSYTERMLFWSGSAYVLGILDQQVNLASPASLIQQGQAQGPPSPNAVPLYEIPIENHDRATTSDSEPIPLQGANTVEWDVFPTPAEIPLEPLHDRDLTRYHKAYSFTRPQPVRIRLIRR